MVLRTLYPSDLDLKTSPIRAPQWILLYPPLRRTERTRSYLECEMRYYDFALGSTHSVIDNYGVLFKYYHFLLESRD